MSAPKGLVVPVLRKEKMSFADVEGSIAAFGKGAASRLHRRNGGGTHDFEWWRLRVLRNADHQPAERHLGMHSIVETVCRSRSPDVAGMMNVALTYDHRRDGREADVLKIHQGIGGRSS